MALCGLRAPLEGPAPRGVTHVSPYLSRGYDESTESPSGFLIFPTVAITSRSRSQTPLFCGETPRMDSCWVETPRREL